MKIMIASDLHGSFTYTKKLIDKYKQEHFDSLILLGDLLYHGPRNDLPEGYAPKKVIELLNSISSQILWIQGNCDAEVDQMVLNFPMLVSKDIILGGHKVHLEHGHHLNEDAIKESDVVLYGHTHIPRLEIKNNVLYGNPGSTSIPKENSTYSYMVWEDNQIEIRGLDDSLVKKYRFTE